MSRNYNWEIIKHYSNQLQIIKITQYVIHYYNMGQNILGGRSVCMTQRLGSNGQVHAVAELS